MYSCGTICTRLPPSHEDHLVPFVIFKDEGTVGPFCARIYGSTAADTGVVALVGTALLLCAIWAFTKWPAARALQRLSSPARTPAAMIRANCRALSPGVVWWAPLTPSISSIEDCASRMVPPPMVPTSMDGIETLICRLPLLLCFVSMVDVSVETGDLLLHDCDTIAAFYDLGWILPSCNEHGCNDIGRMSVEPTQCTCHGTADQVFGGVQLNESINITL